MEINIKKGHHRPKWSFPKYIPRLLNTSNIVMEYTFIHDEDSLCINNHLNKLFGFTIGFRVHENSFRFTYSDMNGEIYAYYYIDGVRKYRNMQLYNRKKKPVHMRITRLKESILFEARLEGEKKYTTVHIPFVSTCNYGLKLWCYYGGKPKAPRDIRFHLNRYV